MKLVSVKILEKDVRKIDALKLKKHKTEPRWSVIERAIFCLEQMEEEE
jgi:hypothetical protein